MKKLSTAKRYPLKPCSEEKINEVKLEVCRAIRRVAMREGWTQRDLAIFCGASESRIGHAVRQELDKVTLEQLFRYLTSLYPRYRMIIAI